MSAPGDRDRPPPRRPSSHWGEERRIAISKPARGSIAIPVHVDTETTPPPSAPPEPATRDSYDSVPPPIREQLELLHGAVSAQAEAIARVWDSRNDGKRLDQLEVRLGDISRETAASTEAIHQFVMPGLKTVMGSIDAIEQSFHRDAGRQAAFWNSEWPRVVKDLEKLEEQLNRIERSFDRRETEDKAYREQQAANQQAMARRIESAEAANLALVARVAGLEHRNVTADAEARGALQLSTKQKAWFVAVIAAVSTLVAIAANALKAFH